MPDTVNTSVSLPKNLSEKIDHWREEQGAVEKKFINKQDAIIRILTEKFTKGG